MDKGDARISFHIQDRKTVSAWRKNYQFASLTLSIGTIGEPIVQLWARHEDTHKWYVARVYLWPDHMDEIISDLVRQEQPK